jgi:hypothetical protein
MVMDLKKKIDDDSEETDPWMIGSLMYLAKTKPDSFLVMNVLRQDKTHLITIKHILRYASIVNLSLQDMQIQIEQRVQWTRREHMVLVLP